MAARQVFRYSFATASGISSYFALSLFQEGHKHLITSQGMMLAVCEAFVRVRRSNICRLDRRRCRRYGLALQLEDGMYGAFYAIVRPFYPRLKTLFPNYVTTTECVGRAMLNVTKRGFPNPVLENRDINVMCAKDSK